MLMLSHEFYGILDRSISSPEHGRELIYGLNAIENGFYSN